MNNRRLPLEEKNQVTELAPVADKVDKRTTGKVDRLQKLKEWQEKRNAMKEQEKKKQLKPFYAGSTNVAQGNKPGLTITAVPSRPVTRLQVKNATNKLNVAAQKQPKQTKPTTQVQGRKATKENLRVTKVESKPKTVKSSDKQINVQPSKPVPKVVKQDTMRDKESQTTPPADQIDKWISSSKKTTKPSTNNVNFEERFLGDKPMSPFQFGSQSNVATNEAKAKSFNFSMRHKSNSMFVNLSRGGTSKCTPPSPLCFRYKAADDLMNTPQQQDSSEEVLPLEDSLASVKRNCFHDPSNCDPVIVASKPPIDVACNDTDSGNVGDDSSDSSDNEQDDKNKDTSHCDSKDSAVDEEQDVQLVTEDSSAVVMAGVSGATPQSQEVQRFKDLHADTIVILTKHCEVWEKKADEMTSVATADNEDVLGQIRTAIGQAQLLVNKKLKQFLGLCHNAEEGKGEKRTTPDDLQGFWDMVSYQIDDVQHKFLRLEELEKNGWVVEQVASKKKPMKKMRGAAKRKAEPEVSEEQKQRLAEQREKRAAARNRLKEMKAAAKRGNQKEDEPMPMDDNVFEEFVSSVAVMELTTPKKKKGDCTDSCVFTQVRRSTRKTPNKYRRKSTVSRSSTSEENEAPVVVQPNKALENTNLIFFDSPQQSSESLYVTGYDFSQYVTPPSPSETGCLQPTPYSLLSEDSLGKSNTTSN